MSPEGKLTDFHRAVGAANGRREDRLGSWQIWPSSREFLDAAEEKMHQDPRMEMTGDMPFDARAPDRGLLHAHPQSMGRD